MCFTIYSRLCTLDSTSTFWTITVSCFLLWEVGGILAPPTCSAFVNQQTNGDRNQIRVFQSSQCTSKGNNSSSRPSFGLHCLWHWCVLHGLQLHPPIIPGAGVGRRLPDPAVFRDVTGTSVLAVQGGVILRRIGKSQECTRGPRAAGHSVGSAANGL